MSNEESIFSEVQKMTFETPVPIIGIVILIIGIYLLRIV